MENVEGKQQKSQSPTNKHDPKHILQTHLEISTLQSWILFTSDRFGAKLLENLNLLKRIQ